MHCRDSVKDVGRFLGFFGSTNYHDLNLTTRLFFAVGSPYAILQLRDIFKALKRNDALLPFSKARECFVNEGYNVFGKRAAHPAPLLNFEL